MEYAVLDIENVGEPFDGTLVCVGVYVPSEGSGPRAYTFDEFESNLDGVRDLLADAELPKVTFTKHDHRWLRLRGYEVNGPLVDVQSMAWTANENSDLDLATCSRLYGEGEVKDPRISQRAGRPMFRLDDGTVVPLEDTVDNELWLAQVLAYNEQDLVSTDATFEGLRKRLAFEGEELTEYWERDVLPFTSVLLDIECRGIPVDVEEARELRVRLEAEVAELTRELKDTAELPDDFNLGSSDQLGRFLYSRTFDHKRRLPITKEQRADLKADPTERHAFLPLGFTVTTVGTQYVTGVQQLVGKGFKPTRYTDACTKKRGQHPHKVADGCKPSTDSKVLRVQFGDDPWVQSYLEMSKRRTIVNTFLSTFEEVAHGGRIYGRFNQTGTATGRLSSSNPNLQNIPSRGELGRAVRELFVPPPGHVFIHGDYGQLEPRVMAHFSGDPVLLDIFENGEDIYLRTAEEVYRERIDKSDERRSAMKVYVLALGYGAWPKTLREQLAVSGFFVPLHEVEETFEKLQGVYRVLFDWREDVIADARELGYTETLSGHRRRISFGRATTWREAAAGREGRQAANSKVQGSAADIVARSMSGIEAEYRGDPRILVQVHDELLLEARRGVELRHPDLLSRIEAIATREHGFDLRVPLDFKPRLVASWAEGKD